MRRFVCFLLLLLSTTVKAQDQDFVFAPSANVVLNDVYPSPLSPLRKYAEGVQFDIVKAGEQVRVYAYEKKYHKAYVFNNFHMGWVMVTGDLEKQIRQNGITDLRNKDNFRFQSIRSQAERYISSYYYALHEREEAINVSIQRERAQVLEQARKDSVERVLRENAQVYADSMAFSKRKRFAERLDLYRQSAPIHIQILGFRPDHAGGVEIPAWIANCTQRTIKYITLTGFFLNAVGDKCRDEIHGSTVWQRKGVGPIKPIPESVDYIPLSAIFLPNVGQYNFDNPRFYSHEVHSLKLTKVVIEYMDGHVTTLQGKQLDGHVEYPRR